LSAQRTFTRDFLNPLGIPPSEYRRAASRPASTEAEPSPEPRG
jgi:hypothetical protein